MRRLPILRKLKIFLKRNQLLSSEIPSFERFRASSALRHFETLSRKKIAKFSAPENFQDLSRKKARNCFRKLQLLIVLRLFKQIHHLRRIPKEICLVKWFWKKLNIFSLKTIYFFKNNPEFLKISRTPIPIYKLRRILEKNELVRIWIFPCTFSKKIICLPKKTQTLNVYRNLQ